VSRHGKRRTVLRRWNRRNRALKEQITKETAPLTDNQCFNNIENSVKNNKVTDCASTTNYLSSNSDNLENKRQKHNSQDTNHTLPPPTASASYSPISSPELPVPPPLLSEGVPFLPYLSLPLILISLPFRPRFLRFYRVWWGSRRFCKRPPQSWGRLARLSLSEFPIDFEEQPHHNETPEPTDPYPLSYFLSQFLLFDFPIAEEAFCVGPGPVDHELINFLTTAPSDFIIPWYLPGSRLPLGVPVQVLWKKFPPCLL